MRLLQENPHKTLLCLTVIMPGSDKRNKLSLTIAHAAVEAMKKTFGSFAPIIERDLETGYEAYLLTALPQQLAKRRATAIEDEHPLGRLFDIDVIDRNDMTPISRKMVGQKPRRCLICNSEARLCMREHRHTQTELLERIRQIVEDYTTEASSCNIENTASQDFSHRTPAQQTAVSAEQDHQSVEEEGQTKTIAPELCEITTLPLTIARNRDRIESFLAANGLRFDPVDTYLAAVAPDGNIVAGAGLAGDVIKCVAVSEAGRNGGWAGKLVSELLSIATTQGIDNVKVFTKPKNRDIFSGLGFSIIGEAPDALAMEHNPAARRSYTRYLKSVAESAEAQTLEAGHTLQTGELTQGLGIIIMNANPFTCGHRYLVKQAARQVSHLFVMVVSEDRSVFASNERKDMVRLGCADIANVTVCETQHYAISSTTFPTYFLKDLTQAADTQMRLDLDVFCNIIAPTLGITKRFVGSEPTDALTARYNQLMHEFLPPRGIDVIEIQRLETAFPGTAISASRVRRSITEGRLSDIVGEVPPTTLAYCLAHGVSLALRTELDTTPKPGLVDKHDAGAHKDMDYALMSKSICALHPWFVRLALMGLQPQFPTHNHIVGVGLEAEIDMMAATRGVNTHKGALFCMGLTLIAATHLIYNIGEDTLAPQQSLTASQLQTTISKIAADFRHKDGALRMAHEGYAELFRDWLPFFRQHRSTHRLLLYIMSTLNDTNIVRRCGTEIAEQVKNEAAALINADNLEARLSALNETFVEQNISPGGAADMLALTIFIDNLLPQT